MMISVDISTVRVVKRPGLLWAANVAWMGQTIYVSL
jgi:hypothetical protein